MTLNQKLNLVPLTGPRVDQLLEHVNLDRWQRPAPLLRLVAYWSAYPQFAPISRSDIIGALGRTQSEARYDHAVMIRMAAQRILQRLPGRPDAWRVNPDLLNWRAVPGVPSWRAVALSFLAAPPDNRSSVSVNGAGRDVGLSVNQPRFGPVPAHPLSVEPHHFPTNDQHSLTEPPAATPPGLTPSDTPGGPPSLLIGSTTYFPHSLEPSEGVSEDQRKAGKRLLEAVRRGVHTPLMGAPAARVEAVGARHADRVSVLISRIPELAGLRTGTGVAQAVEGLATQLEAPTPADPAELLAKLRVRLATLEAEDPESEEIPKLRSKLADLGDG